MAGAKLTDTQVSKTKGKDKPYKLSDGGGLFLYVTPAGGKFWRWQYRFQGKPQLLSVGEYPLMSLKESRIEHQRWQGVVPEVGSLTLHRFRRTYITMLLRSGLDLATVQRYAGHSDLASTMRYLRPESAVETQDRISAIVWE
jgi:integrase